MKQGYQLAKPIESKCPKCGQSTEELRGNRISRQWVKEHIEGGFCYSCTRWRVWSRCKDEWGHVVCQGRLYTIQGDLEYERVVDPSQVFVVNFFDGRTVIVRNLACRGAIPPWWRQELPDNAHTVETVKDRLLHLTGVGNSVRRIPPSDDPDDPVIVIKKEPKRKQGALF